MWYFILSTIYLTIYSYSFLKEYNRINFINNFKRKLKPFEGNDMRFPEEEIPDSEEIGRISSYFVKDKWLRTLENNISLYDKVSLIESYRIFEEGYVPNIMAGGLMNDYNYTI